MFNFLKAEQEFDTTHKYAIFHGFLIIPFLVAAIQFLGAIVMVLAVNPTSIEGFDQVIYYTDLVRIPILIIAFILMLKRNLWYRFIMIIYFWGNAFYLAAYYFNDLPTDLFQIVMCIAFVLYFLLSRRVRATFN